MLSISGLFANLAAQRSDRILAQLDLATGQTVVPVFKWVVATG